MRTKNNRAYALPLVLTLIMIASLALGYALKDSLNNLIVSNLRSAEQKLNSQANEAFTASKELFSSIVEEILVDSLLRVDGTPTLPDDLLLIGELPLQTDQLIAAASFDPLIHGVMQNERWATLESKMERDASNISFDDIYIEVQCVGESDELGVFQVGICSRSLVHYPKVFEMRVTLRDEKDHSLYTTVTAELSMNPLSLNDFSMVLTSSDRVVFGDGFVNGNISINLDNDSDVIFMNGGDLTFNGLFTVSEKSKLKFGHVSDDGLPPVDYEMPNFTYGIKEGVVDQSQLVGNFTELENDPQNHMIHHNQPNESYIPDLTGILQPGEQVLVIPNPDGSELTLMNYTGPEVRFGEDSSEENCLVEISNEFLGVLENESVSNNYSCNAGDPNFIDEGTVDGPYSCHCLPGGPACVRNVQVSETVRSAAALPENTVIQTDSVPPVNITSLDEGQHTAVYCGEAFTLVADTADIQFKRSFEQKDLSAANWKTEKIQAAFVTLGENKKIRLMGDAKTRTPDYDPDLTLYDLRTSDTPAFSEDDISFRIDAALGAVGVSGRVELASNLTSISDSTPHRPFGQIQLNGSIIGEKTPFLRKLIDDGTTRVGFSKVGRTFIPPQSPGFNTAIVTSWKIAVSNVSSSSFRAEEAFQIAGIENPATIP